MERKDCRSSTGLQCSRQLLHKLIQNLKLPVHINPKGLEGTLAGLFDGLLLLFFRKEIQSFLNDLTKLCGGIHVVSFADFICDRLGKLFTVWLV